MFNIGERVIQTVMKAALFEDFKEEEEDESSSSSPSPSQRRPVSSPSNSIPSSNNLNEKRRASQQYRSVERKNVGHPNEDPLANDSVSNAGSIGVKREELSIRLEDEGRIVDALNNAAKKQTTGSIYSVKIDISRTGSLGIGKHFNNHNS